MTDVIEEASSVMQELVSESLSEVLQSRVLGRLRDFPASSCSELAAAGLTTSGHYWVRAANGSTVGVYCDLTTSFRAGPFGFVQVTDFDSSEQHECPPSLQSVENSCGRMLCGRGQVSPGCSSVYYSTFGISYSIVCGRVIGYQFSTPNAFLAHHYDPTISLDDAYLDGVSLTHGLFSREHIWSFAAAVADLATDHSNCPCSKLNQSATLSVPSFVQQQYFCETGNHKQSESGKWFCEDPLWDGQGCGDENACCDHQSGGSWFCVDLGKTVTADIELRLCGNEDISNEDTALESVQLYIQ